MSSSLKTTTTTALRFSVLTALLLLFSALPMHLHHSKKTIGALPAAKEVSPLPLCGWPLLLP